MPKTYWNLDRVLIRVKDIFIVSIGVWGLLVGVSLYYPLPKEVEALAETTVDHEKRLSKLEAISSDIHEIKLLLKGEH